jgi:hypothetical protein
MLQNKRTAGSYSLERNDSESNIAGSLGYVNNLKETVIFVKEAM